jgi:hypothetical protein
MNWFRCGVLGIAGVVAAVEAYEQALALRRYDDALRLQQRAVAILAFQ